MDLSISPFFQPKAIAIIGASSDKTKLGFAVARNMIQSGYPDKLYFINPKGGELFGRSVFKSVTEVPGPVDLAILIIPAPAVPAAINEIGLHGIRAAIISSGGFREVGPDGAKLESECLEIAHKYHIRLIGPNCIGLIDYHLPMDTSFINQPPPPKGDLAFISQSGAVCGVIMDWAGEHGIGFSRILSLGNQADVTETDMLPGIVDDEKTRAITFYIESIRDGRRFVEVARNAARHKPLIAMKVGQSISGQRAAASHTGALAGMEAAYKAAFHRAGVLQASSIEEMFDWAVALSECPLPQPGGNRIAILTNAGGPGVIAADVLEANHLTLAVFSYETETGLKALLPPPASLGNPLDMLGGANHEMYSGCLQLLLDDPGVDGVLVILPPPPVDSAEADAEAMIPLIQLSSKPVVLALMGGRTIQKAVGLFRVARIPEYRFAERAVSALGVLVQRAEFLAKLNEKPARREDIDLQAAKIILKDARPGSFLNPLDSEGLMAAYGISTAPVRLARTEIETSKIATELGFPVVLKVASPDIQHKSDIGGVLLNIQSADEAQTGFLTLIQRARTERTDAWIEGVLVQRMVSGGQDVIIGAKKDPQFGTLMMFGSGGVEVEGLKDVAFALGPLLPSEADDLLKHTWAGRKLEGFRSILPADSAAVKEVLQRLAQLAFELPEIDEIEINPLRVLGPGEGVVALDVRVKME